MRCMRSPSVFALLTTLALAACALSASAQGVARVGPFDPRSGKFSGVIASEPARPPDTVAVSIGKAWTALAQVYDQLGIKLSVADREGHVIGVLRGMQHRPIAGNQLSRLLECGSGPYGPNAERYTVHLTMLSYISAVNDTLSAIDTRVGGTASPNGVSATVVCASSGVLEEKVAALLRKALGL